VAEALPRLFDDEERLDEWRESPRLHEGTGSGCSSVDAIPPMSNAAYFDPAIDP
jgi:hypothetical protein